jgi:fatty acid desaturase
LPGGDDEKACEEGLTPEDRIRRGPLMVAIENILLAAVTVFAFALTVIALLSWRRVRDGHFLLLGAAFAAFFAKGLFLTFALLEGWQDLAQLLVFSAAFDLVILALFYGFTLRR